MVEGLPPKDRVRERILGLVSDEALRRVLLALLDGIYAARPGSEFHDLFWTWARDLGITGDEDLMVDYTASMTLALMTICRRQMERARGSGGELDPECGAVAVAVQELESMPRLGKAKLLVALPRWRRQLKRVRRLYDEVEERARAKYGGR